MITTRAVGVVASALARRIAEPRGPVAARALAMLGGTHFLSGASQPGASASWARHPVPGGRAAGSLSAAARLGVAAMGLVAAGAGLASPMGPGSPGGADAVRAGGRPGPVVRAAATQVGSRSVEAPRPALPSAFDFLFAGLAGTQGWVHSPGAVEATAERMRAHPHIVVAVGCPSTESHGLDEAVASAALLARIAKADGKTVSVMTDAATRGALSAALERDGTTVDHIGDATPGGSRDAAIGRVAGPGPRMMLVLGPTVSAEATPESRVVTLSRYPLASEIVSAGLAATQRIDAQTLPFGGDRVHGPSAGDAGYAVAAHYAATIGKGDLVPVPERHLASVHQARADLSRGPGGPDRSRPAFASRVDSDIVTGAELIRAIALSPVSRAPSGRPVSSPFLVAAFDSSNGGIIAARNAAGELKKALGAQGDGRDVNLVVVADHANAPYGKKSPQELVALVVGGLTGSALLRPDAIMMACNTACTAFPAALDQFRSSQDHDIPVVDLIDTTVQAMKAQGGFVSLFSTEGTKHSNAYQSALTREGVPHAVVACPDWADLVNDNRHVSASPDDRKLVQKSVDEQVAALLKAAPDTQTIWLCCTHYPGLKPFIERSLQQRGRDIPVIDPMTKQAEAVAGLLAHRAPGEARGAARGISVVTSDSVENVRPLAQTLLDNLGVEVFSIGNVAHRHGQPASREASGAAGLAALANVRRHAVGLPADPRDAQLQAYVMRNVDQFAATKGPERLAGALADKQKVMLLTGFSVAPGKPETDGPPGTAVLAKTLVACGKDVTIVVDRGNEAAMRGSLGAIVAQGGKVPELIVFDPPEGAAADHAAAILDERRPDAVVAIELPGRTPEGTYLNMRGASIGEFNAPVDTLLIAAESRPAMFTAGIGDGGNEAGVGNLSGIPKGRYEGREVDFKTAVPSRLPVTAWNSNFGAIATAIELAHRMDVRGAMPDPADVKATIAGALEGGAVDGVTREPAKSVDGFSDAVHARFAQLYMNALEPRR
ncbi:MAG: hypothetical protein RJA99_3934 [Pseudomonadota bacterium]|jgi:glutamate racemase